MPSGGGDASSSSPFYFAINRDGVVYEETLTLPFEHVREHASENSLVLFCLRFIDALKCDISYPIIRSSKSHFWIM